MFGEAMRVGGMFSDCQRRVVVEDATEHVARLAWRAGNRLGGVDAAFVGGVGVECERSVVITKIARIEAAEQAGSFHREALTIGGGALASAPDKAEFQVVVVIDQDSVGRLERGVAQEPSAGVLQRFSGKGIDALAHGGEAKIGAVGDQSSERCGSAPRG